MKISDDTLRKIHDTSIVTVADKLGIKLYGMGDENRKACCPYHEDQHPSLHFSTKRGCFKCFVCGAKGDAIKLVQDQEHLTFTEACEWIIKECNIIVTDDAPIKSNTDRTDKTDKKESDKSVSSVQSVVPLSPNLVSRSLSLDSQFCKSAISAGYLTESQLRHAASRYRLGCSKGGGVIFWQIDEQQRVHTGKIMYYQPDCHRDKELHPTWVHCLMRDTLPPNFDFQPCLFGLHLLSTEQPTAGNFSKSNSKLNNSCVPIVASEQSSSAETNFAQFPSEAGNKVALVESEKTAVILSEKFPDFIWLSCGGLQSFKPQLLEPLLQYRIIIFPDTDPQGEAFRLWNQVALDAQRLYKFRYPLRVSNLLEQHATPDQKQRKIDLVDFIFEVCDSARTVSCSHEHCRAQADSTEGQHGSLGSNG